MKKITTRIIMLCEFNFLAVGCFTNNNIPQAFYVTSMILKTGLDYEMNNKPFGCGKSL